MPINPTPQPVDVVINPNGESPKVKDFIINAPLIVQSTNVKNKLDTITETTEVLSTRISALESNSVINTSNSVVNTINNIINQSDPYFVSITPNSIETSGSLYLSGAIRTTYISSSTGARITGSVTQGHPSNISSGEYSHAEGEGTKAVNFGSHAEGYLTTANSNGSHAEGHLSYTFSLIGPDKLGYSAHAEGTETSACGNYSHSEGYRTHASGAQSHTEGDNTISYGAASHAEGNNTITNGNFSHAEGYYTKTESTGLYAHVEGAFTTGSTEGCHVEGRECYTEDLNSFGQNGKYAHVEGHQSHAAGDYSHAEGYQTVASGSYSHAEGHGTIAKTFGSHAQGKNTVAQGIYSFASGLGTWAEGSGLTAPQFACGAYNIKNNINSLFVVGNGTSDSTRNDLFKIEKDGSIIINTNDPDFGKQTYIAGGQRIAVKEIGPLTSNPQILYYPTTNDYCIIAYSNAPTPSATFISLPALGTLPLGTTFIIKNSWSSPQNAYIGIEQGGGAQQIDNNFGPVILTPGTGLHIVLMRAGFWQIIGRM